MPKTSQQCAVLSSEQQASQAVPVTLHFRLIASPTPMMEQVMRRLIMTAARRQPSQSCLMTALQLGYLTGRREVGCSATEACMLFAGSRAARGPVAGQCRAEHASGQLQNSERPDTVGGDHRRGGVSQRRDELDARHRDLSRTTARSRHHGRHVDWHLNTLSQNRLAASEAPRLFGVDDPDVLVVAGASQQFNPTLDSSVIERARASDPEGARAEWDAEFRSDIGALLDDQTIEAAIDYGRPLELPPLGGYTFHRAFCDASGGVGADSYTLAVGHKEGAHFVIDLVRGTGGKFDPDLVTEEYAALLREYRAFQVTGDSYVRTVGSRRLAQGRHRLFQV